LPPAFRGEDNDLILTDLGFSEAEIKACNEANILIRGAPHLEARLNDPPPAISYKTSAN
jgi:hypothetical protein